MGLESPNKKKNRDKSSSDKVLKAKSDKVGSKNKDKEPKSKDKTSAVSSRLEENGETRYLEIHDERIYIKINVPADEDC